MSRNSVINGIFVDFQKNINAETELQDAIRSICKEVGAYSREAINILQVIHHDEASIPATCLHVRQLLDKARAGYCKLVEIVPPTDYYRYHDYWRNMTQKYCFLICLIIWLEKGIPAMPETVAEILGINATEQKTGFHLDIEDYLHGLLQLCTELSRLAVTSVIQGDYSRPQQISNFVMELNAGFRLLNFKNDFLRKRYDVLKYDVKKIEEVVYDLSVRGLLPKPLTEEGGAPATDGAPGPDEAPVPGDAPAATS